MHFGDPAEHHCDDLTNFRARSEHLYRVESPCAICTLTRRAKDRTVSFRIYSIFVWSHRVHVLFRGWVAGTHETPVGGQSEQTPALDRGSLSA